MTICTYVHYVPFVTSPLSGGLYFSMVVVVCVWVYLVWTSMSIPAARWSSSFVWYLCLLVKSDVSLSYNISVVSVDIPMSCSAMWCCVYSGLLYFFCCLVSREVLRFRSLCRVCFLWAAQQCVVLFFPFVSLWFLLLVWADCVCFCTCVRAFASVWDCVLYFCCFNERLQSVIE